MKVLLDTSYFIAREQDRPCGELPEGAECLVSAVTLAELTVGVLHAGAEERADRMMTLAKVESTWDPLPVDADVARRFARIVASLKARGRRVPVLDALVAATAMVEGAAVVTQDDDFDAVAGLTVLKV